MSSGRPEGAVGAPAVRTFPRSLLVAMAFWVSGMMLAQGPMILSGLRQVPGNLVDTRLHHYLMEHEYRCLSGERIHRSLWNPPIFFPAQNTAAYSETILGAAPFYWIWRVVGVPFDAAYPLWLLTLCTLNYLSAFLLLRRGLERTLLASSFGAFLFSFASLRVGHFAHPQLIPGFYLVLSIYALVGIFREEEPRKTFGRLALLAVALLGQAYTCFYIAWFLGLGLAASLMLGLALPGLRPATLKGLRIHWKGFASVLLVVGGGLVPFLIHSLRAVGEVGYREYDEVEMFLPRLQSWVYFGPGHWLYGGLSGLRLFSAIPTRFTEHEIGLGVLTWVMAVLGLWNLRKTAVGRLLMGAGATLLICTLLFPGGASLWGLIYLVVPGAKAVRAVGRVSLVLLVPASVGVAAWVDAGRWKKPLLLAGVLFAMLEQGRSTRGFDRLESRDRAARLARRVDPSATAFFYSTNRPAPAWTLIDSLPDRIHVDAMIASLGARVPTVNGYSGWSPPGWPFETRSILPTPAARADVERELGEWCQKHGLDPARIQRVHEDQ